MMTINVKVQYKFSGSASRLISKKLRLLFVLRILNAMLCVAEMKPVKIFSTRADQ